MRHKWATVIHAMAEGLKVQYQYDDDLPETPWRDANAPEPFINPFTRPDFKWRIKLDDEGDPTP